MTALLRTRIIRVQRVIQRKGVSYMSIVYNKYMYIYK